MFHVEHLLMGEYLRRTDLVPPASGEQRTHYWVKIIEEPTLAALELAVNTYLINITDPALIIRGFLLEQQYHYIPPIMAPNAQDERHVMKLSWATVGKIAFVVPTVAS